jgi:hypothetical protein
MYCGCVLDRHTVPAVQLLQVTQALCDTCTVMPTWHSSQASGSSGCVHSQLLARDCFLGESAMQYAHMQATHRFVHGRSMAVAGLYDTAAVHNMCSGFYSVPSWCTHGFATWSRALAVGCLLTLCMGSRHTRSGVLWSALVLGLMQGVSTDRVT